MLQRLFKLVFIMKKSSQERIIIGVEQLRKASHDYQLVVFPYYREEAAKTIQSWWKKEPLYFIKKLTEHRDPHFNRRTANLIKNNRYDLIEYNKFDFTRCLFGALRQGDITMNELITAKLMFESLSCFNDGPMPKQPEKVFARYQLADPNGPYQYQSIYYGSNKQHLDIDERLHYYVIDLPRDQAVCFLYTALNAYDTIKGIPSMRKVLQGALLQYKQKLSEQSIIETDDDALFVKQYTDLIWQNMYQASYSCHFIKNEQNGRFIAAFFNIGEQLPFLCRKSPTSDATIKDTPLLSFVIPTIDTFNLLQQMAHGPNAVLPVGVVGPVTTRMIRAYDEIPPALLSREALTETQRLLKHLYPTVAMIKANARPLELTHPDAEKTTRPHDADCSDFLLSWHDLLHAWRNGANLKPIIRKLRRLHDETAGLDNNKRGMSRALWKLSDLDSSQGAKFRRNQDENIAMQCYCALTLIMRSFEKAGFKHKVDHDDNYLMSYSVCQDDWQPLFFHQSLTSLYQTMLLDSNVSKSFNNSDYAFRYRVLMDRCEMVNEYLHQHPQASVIDVILSHRLKPLQIGDQALLMYLSKYYKTLFFWSKNEGLYFKKPFRFPGINSCVRSHDPEAIRALLYTSINLLHDNQQTALIDLIQTAEPLLLYNVLTRHPEAEVDWKPILHNEGPTLLGRLVARLHLPSSTEESQVLPLLKMLVEIGSCLDDRVDWNQGFLDIIRQKLTCWPATNLFGDEKRNWIQALQMMNDAGFSDAYDYYRIVVNSVWFSWFTNLVFTLMLVVDDVASELETDFGLCFKVFALLHICESLIKAWDEVLWQLNHITTVALQTPTDSNAFNNIYKEAPIPSNLIKLSLFATSSVIPNEAGCFPSPRGEKVARSDG